MKGVAFFLCLSGAAFAAPPQFPIENVSVRSIGPGGGGFIDCVLASRHSKTRFYAGCDVGGFYRSDDGGRSWRILNDGFSNQMCESIAEHPRDPDVLVAGSDGGVYVSRDGGYHWEHPTEGFPPAQGFGYGRPIIRVEFDETNPDHVWAASGCPRGRTGKDHLQGRFGRIFESFDAGRTWRQIKDESGVLARKETEIRSFSASTGNAKDLLVSTSRGVFRSLDGGRNWAASGEGIPVEEGFGPEILARCASAPDVVYLSARSNRGEVPRRCGVWKSTDGGATWRACGTPPAHELRHAGEWAHSYWSHPHLVCDAKDPDVCWASSVTWLSPQGVWKTEDGGRTWAQKFDMKHRGWLDFWGFFSGALTVSRTFRDTVAFGTSGTIYRTDDAGASWRQAYTTERTDGKLQGSGLETICTQCVYADRARRDRMYFGFNDVALFVSEDRGRTLKRTMKGVPDGFSNSCFDIRQAEDEPNRMWAVFGRWGGDESGLFCESTDGGESWSVKTNGFVCGAWARIAVVRGVKPYCLAVVRTGYHRPERRGTTMTWDGGESWHEVSTNDLPIARRPCSVFADRGTILIGSGAGRKDGARIFASKDLGRRWFEIPAAAEMRMGNVREFAVSGKTIAVACQSVNEGLGGVFVSRDCGKTWRHALRDWCASSVAFAGERLFATCPRPGWCDPNDSGHGLVVSDDFGETWRQCRGTGFYRGPVSMVVADPFDASTLYVGTGGNGVFEVKCPRERAHDDRTNPERGYRYEIRIGLEEGEKAPKFQDRWPFDEPFDDGVTVAQAYCYLKAYVDRPVSEAKIAALERDFARARERGVKFLLRFAYESKAKENCPTLERILGHIRELTPVVRRNADVLYALQIGWVGLWGEFHTNPRGLDKDPSVMAALVKATLEMLPENRSTMMRRQTYREQAARLLGWDIEKLHRVGFFNDGTLANYEDGGTFIGQKPYGMEGCPEFDAVTRQSAWYPVDGELFWNHGENPVYSSGLAAIKRLALHHYSTFSVVHGNKDLDMEPRPGAIDAWKATPLTPDMLRFSGLKADERYFASHPSPSAYAYIRDHLGYRLGVESAECDRSADGRRVTGKVVIRNDGFARPVNPRPVWLVLVSADGGIREIRTDMDARSFAAGETTVLPFETDLSESDAKKPLRAALWLPDEAEGLRLRPAYAVAFAYGVTRELVGGRLLNVFATVPAAR